MVGGWQPHDDGFLRQTEDELFGQQVANQFKGAKRAVVELLLNGYNFHSAGQKLRLKNSEVYKIKKELAHDLSWLRDRGKVKTFVNNNIDDIDNLFSTNAEMVEKMSLTEYIETYLYDYDPEAIAKNWQTTAFQNTLEKIWEENSKSRVQAPREHLKTFSVLAYILKKIHTRKYPLEINYYHLNDDLAIEKFRLLRRMIERNPILYGNFKIEQAASWKEDLIQLQDGTQIVPASYEKGVIGKHPHMIILDDVIDRKVIYSDTRNQRAIDKFYTDIYPQISKDEPDRKIIIVGTAQRKDDLYMKLPKDFACFTFKAITDEEKHQVLCPEIYSFEGLMKIKEDISFNHGERFWLKEYMNVPFEAMGLIVKPDDIMYYDTLTPKFLNSLRIYQGWDLSVGKDVEKGDWTVGITIGVLETEKSIEIYILDVFRARINFAQRLEAIVEQAKKWKPIAIGVEDVAFQYDTIQVLKEKTLLPIRGVKAIKNKVESFKTELAPHFENHRVKMAQNMFNLRDELLGLPVGEHDDQADALKIAIKIAYHKEPTPRIRSLL